MNVLTQIAAKASAAGLEFLIAGGHAVIAHGYARNTFDLDLVVRRTEEQRWCVLLQGAGYRQVRKGTAFIQFSAEEQALMPVDLMLVNDSTFLQMFESAVLLESLQPPVRAVSLRHLLALKCHAIKHGHRGRIVKDADDVINLVGINRLNLEEPEIKGIFEKYAQPSFMRKCDKQPAANDLPDLVFPDWSGMDDHPHAFSPARAINITFDYRALFPGAARKWEAQRPQPVDVEFVL